jgi:hypothetical protein
MILVDTALRARAEAGRPVQFAIYGAGFMARGLANQTLNYMPGMRPAVICNRTVEAAIAAYRFRRAARGGGRGDERRGAAGRDRRREIRGDRRPGGALRGSRHRGAGRGHGTMWSTARGSRRSPSSMASMWC